jgi:hypothetical protein
MRRSSLILALLSAPVAAQTVGPANPDAPIRREPVVGETSREAPINGVLTLYGNQRCPTDRAGNEVVVCVRRGAAEQFRIPKELRDFKVTPENQGWAKQQAVTLAAGQAGMGSCTVGMLGSEAGCLAQQARASKADNAERKKEATPDLSKY